MGEPAIISGCYFAGQYGGVHLHVVTTGTVITDERSGESITVTDTEVACKGSVMWVTRPTFEKLRAALAGEER